MTAETDVSSVARTLNCVLVPLLVSGQALIEKLFALQWVARKIQLQPWHHLFSLHNFSTHDNASDIMIAVSRDRCARIIIQS
jgi:hypothetical protein